MKFIDYLTEAFGKNYTTEDMASEIFNDIKKVSDPIINKYKKQIKKEKLNPHIKQDIVFQELSKQMTAYWKGFSGK